MGFENPFPSSANLEEIPKAEPEMSREERSASEIPEGTPNEGQPGSNERFPARDADPWKEWSDKVTEQDSVVDQSLLKIKEIAFDIETAFTNLSQSNERFRERGEEQIDEIIETLDRLYPTLKKARATYKELINNPPK